MRFIRHTGILLILFIAVVSVALFLMQYENTIPITSQAKSDIKIKLPTPRTVAIGGFDDAKVKIIMNISAIPALKVQSRQGLSVKPRPQTRMKPSWRFKSTSLCFQSLRTWFNRQPLLSGF